MFYGLEIRWAGVHKGCEGEVREAESCEAEENKFVKVQMGSCRTSRLKTPLVEGVDRDWRFYCSRVFSC
jgi:hypothetical protein